MDDVVCTSTPNSTEFLNLYDELAKYGKVLIRCPHKSRLTWVFMALYQMVANALLLNLLIAMFSNTFNRINQGMNSLYIY